MLPILLARFSTTISALVRVYARSLPSVGSWACVHCGLKVNAQRTDGTSGLSFAIDLLPPNLSCSKHSVVLTPDGKLLISCESDTSGATRSEAFGQNAGTFSSPKNSAEHRVSDRRLEDRISGFREGKPEKVSADDRKRCPICGHQIDKTEPGVFLL